MGKCTMMKVKVSRRKELMGEFAGTRRTKWRERVEMFRNEREELFLPGKRGNFVMVGGWEGQGSQREGNK